jgi:membrane-bound lytic murein transglycosylase D
VQTVKKQPKTNNDVSLEIKTNNQITASETKINKDDKTNKNSMADTLSTVASYYLVQKGDNLSSIAKKNNVSVAEIKEWNRLSNASIQLGMSLQVTKNEANNNEAITSLTKTENVEYIVKKGDNLGNIAKKFGCTLDDLKQWNTIQNNYIALGSSLIVAKTEVPLEKTSNTTFNRKENLASSSKNMEIDYLVKKGDSLYSISKKYPGVSVSDIKKWNDISGEELKPGMKLKING